MHKVNININLLLQKEPIKSATPPPEGKKIWLFWSKYVNNFKRKKKKWRKFLETQINGIDKRCGVYTQNYTERLLYTLACTHVSHNTQGPHSHGMKLQFPCVTLTFVYYIQKQAKTEMYKVIMPVLVQSKVTKKNHSEHAFTYIFA